MAFQVSPGINVSEIDLTTTVPAIATTTGGLAGVFSWGPAEKVTFVDSEVALVNRFGKPTDDNYETFFSAANFLSYSNQLYVTRAISDTAYNAVANTATATMSSFVVKNAEDYDVVSTSSSFTGNAAAYVAKYPGALGNSLKISVIDTADQYNSQVATSNTTVPGTFTLALNSANATVSCGNTTVAGDILANTVYNALSVGDWIKIGNSSIGTQILQISSIPSPVTTGNVTSFGINFSTVNKTKATYTAETIDRYWEYYNTVGGAPSTSQSVTDAGSTVVDQVHVVVVDEDGKFSGTAGAVLEVYEGLSRATDAKGPDGGSSYYKSVLNNQSKYVWWAADRATAASDTSANVAASSATTPFTLSFVGGADGSSESTISVTSMMTAYDTFNDSTNVDVSLVMAGKTLGANSTTQYQLANYIIDNVADVRKDCIVLISPPRAAVVNNAGSETDDIVSFRNNVRSSSYAVMDSGYKYQYDRYNDVYRYVPLNADIAGMISRSDDARDPWFSPAGFSRGQVKNSIKLAFNPGKGDRDTLYKAGVNPVTTFPGQGTVLYGDKTLLGYASAFDRINVRRLFIVLEKTIANAANQTLFEFNDDFTRSQFRNLIEPFLRDVQGRRGIYDFRVVCDETNNTDEVIDTNRFVGDIYVKPAKSINFIQLNFVAVRSGVEFTEVVGQF